MYGRRAAADDYSALAAVHAEENGKSFAEVELDKARREDRILRDPDYDLQVHPGGVGWVGGILWCFSSYATQTTACRWGLGREKKGG